MIPWVCPACNWSAQVQTVWAWPAWGRLVEIRYMGVACLFLIVGMLTCGLLGIDLRGLRVFGCGLWVCGLLGSGLGGLRLCWCGLHVQSWPVLRTERLLSLVSTKVFLSSFIFFRTQINFGKMALFRVFVCVAFMAMIASNGKYFFVLNVLNNFEFSTFFIKILE